MGPFGMVIDLAAGRLVSGALTCCGRMLGYIKFNVYAMKTSRAVSEGLSEFAGKSVVVGAFDAKTGKFVVTSSGKVVEHPTAVMKVLADKAGGLGSVQCGNRIGCCAEFHAADQMIEAGSVISDIRFVEAVRPRNHKIIPPCENCLQMFRDNFNAGSVPVDMPDVYFVPLSGLIKDE